MLPTLEGKAMPQMRRSRGRPKGLKNRPRQYLTEEDLEEQFIAAIESGTELLISFITEKEKADRELAKQLREEGRITTPGPPFQASNKQEIEGLITKGVFKFEKA